MTGKLSGSLTDQVQNYASENTHGGRHNQAGGQALQPLPNALGGLELIGQFVHLLIETSNGMTIGFNALFDALQPFIRGYGASLPEGRIRCSAPEITRALRMASPSRNFSMTSRPSTRYPKTA